MLFERSLMSRVWLVAAGDVHVRRMPVLWLCYYTIHFVAFYTTARKPLSKLILRWSASLAVTRKRNAAVQSITL
jgi:phosphatidylserine decarboxylase